MKARFGDQYCVSLPARPAKETRGYALWKLTRSELGRLLGRMKARKTRSGPSGFRTAIARRRAPAPMRSLSGRSGACLYHGVGRDQPGVRALRKRCRVVTAYDPHHPDPRMRKRPRGKYDEILSIYTLNVVSTAEGRRVLREIHRMLKPGGRAVLAVRRDTCR